MDGTEGGVGSAAVCGGEGGGKGGGGGHAGGGMGGPSSKALAGHCFFGKFFGKGCFGGVTGAFIFSSAGIFAGTC